MKNPAAKHSKPTPILFTHYGDEWIRGSERCLLDLLAHLDRERFQPVLWCNAETMADEARRIDVPVTRSDFPLLMGWKAPRFDVAGFARLVRQGNALADQHGIALVHANSGAPNQWLNLVARSRRIPLLAHLHSRYPLRDRLSLGLHHVAMAVGVSQPVVDQLLADGMPKERTLVIPNGIDVDRLDAQPRVDLRQELGLGERDFFMVTVGSLIHRKGVDLILEALARLVRSGVPARLAIIGDGPERINLRRQVQALGLQERVFFLGERDDVAGLLRGGVDLFVSGAREEVFGLVLAEAGLAGLPVVAPAVGGIPEVVRDGVWGRLVPAENVAALADAITQFQRSPGLAKAMGAAARDHVMRYFTIDRNVRRFEELYTWLLDDPAMAMSWDSHWSMGCVLGRIGKQLFDRSLGRTLRLSAVGR